MKNAILAAGAALAIGLAPVAVAAPLAGPGLVERVAGSEFRGYYRSQRGEEDVLWRLAPDGTATGIFIVMRHAGPSLIRFEVSDTGRWFVQGDQFCIHWRLQMYGQPNCFNVDAREGTHVRMSGGISLSPIEGQFTR